MDILVLVKQVPDTTEVKIDPKTGNMIREGVPSILNPFDQFALEEAVMVKNKLGGTVTVITLGPDQAKTALMRCLALGADVSIHLSDYAFAGADTLATSFSLASAIKKVGKYDLIFTGQMAQDGETGQVGPEIAAMLDLPQATYVEEIKDITPEKIVVKSDTDEGYRIMELKLPALIAFLPPTSFEYSNPSMSGIIKAKSKPYSLWKQADLGVPREKCGLKGSPTRVTKIYSPTQKTKGVIFADNIEDACKKVAEAIKEKKVVQ
jgi:electron transfer flavoprotein beta subunit